MRTYVLTITSTSDSTTTVPGLHATAFRDYLDGVPAFRGRTTADALLSGADSSPVGGRVEVAADGFVGTLTLRFEGDSDGLTTDAEAVAWWASLSDSERTDAAEWWPADAERAAALHLEARALQAAADFEAAAAADLDARIATAQRAYSTSGADWARTLRNELLAERADRARAAAIAAEARAAVAQSDSDRAARIAAEQAEAAAERFRPLEVCTDCLVWAANRDDSGAGSDWSPERYSAGLEALGGLDLIADGEEQGFTDRACPVCGGLPGDRFSATLEVR